MSQAAPPPPDRQRVEFSPESIRRRQARSRAFRVFALCATFFGLAMLLLFLGRLTLDVLLWFRETPRMVQAENERLEAELVRLRDRQGVVADRLALLERQLQDDLAAANEADRAALRALYDEQIKPRVLANLDVTLPEKIREAEHDLRPDTSAAGVLWHFVSSGPAPEDSPQDAGILYGLLGTLALVAITLVVAVPVGVGAAIYLEEYRSTSWFAGVVQININNLAGVPSVIFGILGAYLFVDLVFRPIEAEMERPARVAEYRLRHEQLTKSGRVKEDPGSDDQRLVALVVDPDGKLDKVRRDFDRLVEQGKAEATANESTRIRAVLDPGGKLTAATAKYEEYLAEKKIPDRVKSAFDIPAAVLKAEGKSPAQVKGETAYAEAMREADGLSQRIAIDQRLVTPPSYFVQATASVFRTLGISLAARNLLGGGLTLALLILPVLIVAAQEAIRAVPQSLRHGALALGATRWQTIRKVVLPSAAPGILTGTILAMCRAMGEAAPLILFGATLYVDQLPGLFSRFTVLPMQIFVWSDRVSDAWRQNAAVASLILVGVLLVLNGVAIYLRQRTQRATRY